MAGVNKHPLLLTQTMRRVLEQFREPNTRPKVREALGLAGSDTVGNAMNSLKQRGMIVELHKRGEHDDIHYPVFVYQISEKGLQALATTPAELLPAMAKAQMSTHILAKPTVFTSDECSVMRRPEYKPEKFEPPRGPESMAFKSLPSKGTR